MQTITYSRDGNLDIKFNLYLPPGKTGSLPTCIYFHGGGLVSGSRLDCLFPVWMQEDAASLGFILIAADHRLIHPYTAFDEIQDMKALFRFLSAPTFSAEYLPESVTLDSTRIAVSGFSGGAYVARLAALYAEPKPKAFLSMFGMGGDFLSDFWVAVKDGPMNFPGSQYATADLLTHLLNRPPARISEATLVWLQKEGLRDSENRMGLFCYWWREGTFLDVLLGREVSAKLRGLPREERLAALSPELRIALPEAFEGPGFPPTMLIHGEVDPVVLIGESQATHERLQKAGVVSKMVIVPGAEHGLMVPHSLDLAPGAAEAQSEGMRFLYEMVNK